MDTYLDIRLDAAAVVQDGPSDLVAQAKAKRDVTLDDSMPLEPYQVISQYTLEPLLKSGRRR